MSPRMKRRSARKKPLSPNLLRFFLALWILSSLGYWIAGMVDLWDTRIHWDQRVNTPFRYDSDSRAIHNVGLQPEARAAGIAPGDRIEGLNGAPYSGLAQWDAVLSESHPGDILDVDVTHPNGSHATCTVTLVRQTYPWGRMSPMFAFWQASFFVGLLPLVCLVIGYWVVLTRPGDRNAWLVLILLTFPTVMFSDSGLSTGVFQFLRLFWYQTIQLAGAPALLLFGIYFPERSRIDARARWVKWILFGIFAVSVAALYPSMYMEGYGGGDGPILTRVSDVAADIINAFNLLCVILYLVLTLDKLRSASTEDARRRLRVLTTGMSIGMGALLIVVLLLPRIGISGNNPRSYWIHSIAALLIMFAPLTLAYVVVVQRALDVRVLLRMGTRYALAKATLWVIQAALLVVVGLRLFLPMFERRVPQPSDIWATLIFLALILALRFGVAKRLEQWLDKQFFREAYNAEVMLNELSDEVQALHRDPATARNRSPHRLRYPSHPPDRYASSPRRHFLCRTGPWLLRRWRARAARPGLFHPLPRQLQRARPPLSRRSRCLVPDGRHRRAPRSRPAQRRAPCAPPRPQSPHGHHGARAQAL